MPLVFAFICFPCLWLFLFLFLCPLWFAVRLCSSVALSVLLCPLTTVQSCLSISQRRNLITHSVGHSVGLDFPQSCLVSCSVQLCGVLESAFSCVRFWGYLVFILHDFFLIAWHVEVVTSPADTRQHAAPSARMLGGVGGTYGKSTACMSHSAWNYELSMGRSCESPG